MNRKRTIIITLIVVAFWVTISGYISYKIHFQYEWAYNRMMRSPETLNKAREMSKEELFRNLELIAEREGFSLRAGGGIYDILVLCNPEYAEKDPKTTLFKDGIPVEGTQLYYSSMGRWSAGQRKPMEIRFAMQTLLYIRGRKLSDELDDLIAIAAAFERNNIYGYNNYSKSVIGIEEFEALYEEYNIGKFPHEKQVDILTHAWIYKTGYDRPGIDSRYRNAP
jgi:hypothetical protein